MKTRRHVFLVGALTAALALAACSGGSGGGSAGGTASPTANASISSASGVLSAFGSVVVNGTEYATADSTSYVDGDRDDAPASADALQVGMTVDVEAVNGRTGPLANLVRFTSVVRGEIDAIDSASSTLTVLGQTVQVTSGTSFAGSTTSGGTTAPVSQLSDLAVGNYVTVYGFVQCTSTGATCTSTDVVASLVFEPATAGVYRVEGYAQGSSGNQFTINGLTVDITPSGASATLCTPAPCAIANGQFVAVRSTAAPSTVAGALTLTATSIRNASQAPVLATGATVSIAGPVTLLNAVTDSFVLRGLSVDGSGLAAAVAALSDGQIVEVTGTVSATGTIVATAITVERFATFALLAPLDSLSASADTLSVLGQQFTVNGTTRFVDWAHGVRPFNLGNFATVLAAGDELIVSGYTTSTGNIATRVERIPTPATPTVGAEGIAAADSSTADTLTIGGVTATLSTSTTLIYPHSGNSPGLAGFFGAVTVGASVVEVIGAPGATAGTITASSALALPSTCQWAY